MTLVKTCMGDPSRRSRAIETYAECGDTISAASVDAWIGRLLMRRRETMTDFYPSQASLSTTIREPPGRFLIAESAKPGGGRINRSVVRGRNFPASVIRGT